MALHDPFERNERRMFTDDSMLQPRLCREFDSAAALLVVPTPGRAGGYPPFQLECVLTV